MSEKPKAGEWWTSALPGQTAGLRVFVVGPPCDFDGTDYVVQEEDLEPYERHLGGWRHLPGCTGFDWVEPKPEVWPKYYRGKLWADYDAFLEIHNASERGIVVRPSGKRELAPVDWDYDAALECVLQGSWIELTEAEALARIATKQPEEMVRVKLQKWVEPNGRGDFKFLRTDNEHGAGGYTRVNEWMEIEVPISKL
jgi:hypothetical protein